MRRRSFMAACLAAIPIPFLPKPKPEPMEWHKIGFKVKNKNRSACIDWYIDGDLVHSTHAVEAMPLSFQTVSLEAGLSEDVGVDWVNVYQEN